MAYKIKDKIEFLADASKILASSLDYDKTLSNIAHLVVNSIADFCMIDLFNEKGELYRVAARVSSSNKERRELAHQMFSYQADPRNKGAIYDAARLGEAILVESLSKKWRELSRIPEERAIIRKLRMESLIFVPMESRNRMIGVLTLVLIGKGSNYNEKDVVLAQELASRAAVAVDNARLFLQSQEALKLRDLFISMAAHELRTPLTTISGYIQLLHSKFKGANTKEARWVDDLAYESSRLTKLVNELLEVNRIKTGQFEYSWTECSLNEVIRRAISDFRFTYPGHQIILQDRIVDGKDMVIGDFNKLLQLIINLLDNAAKFSSPESKIVIRLRSKVRHLYLSIKDHGKGISKKDLPEIFEKFQKGSDHTEEGIGLGLFLAKIITKAHRGKIKIYSKENMGTTVDIILPKVKK